MKDGRIVTVRSFEPEDFEAMLVMFESLSPEALRYGLPPYDRASRKMDVGPGRGSPPPSL